MALYYPSITVRRFTTPLGMVVSIPDTLYDSGVEGREIVIVDAEQVIIDELCSLPFDISKEEEEYTRNILSTHSGLFRQLFTGDGMDNATYRNMVMNACAICPRFGTYVIYQDYFGDQNKNSLARWLFPLRQKIDAAIEDIVQSLEDTRCAKFCMLSRDYVYYSIPCGEKINLKYKYRVV